MSYLGVPVVCRNAERSEVARKAFALAIKEILAKHDAHSSGEAL